jgi:rhodanese-related sulfurtransferase
MFNRPSVRRAAGAISLPLALAAPFLLVGTLALLSCRSLEWFLVKSSLRIKFNDVRWITTRELADWLADENRPQPILLDMRTRAEWEVSHLPQARRVEPASDLERALVGLPKETPIVTYCAVGYRSALAARRLAAVGFSKVRNLDGSIFQWANENRPLVHDGKAASQVHPYSRSWGRLLKPERRAALDSLPNDGY